MEKLHIERNTVQETLVIPLWARREASILYPEIYSDSTASEIIERIDYDFSDIKTQGKMTREFGSLECAMRQYDCSFEVKEYLKVHPKAVVVNLGCGLDNTFRNIDNGTCVGVNVDFPDVIKVRDELLPAGDRERNIGVDINELTWMDSLVDEARDGIIFFAQGVFYYFTEEQVRRLFDAMGQRFPGGCIVFDCANRKACKLMLKTWIKTADIKDVNVYFAVENIDDLKSLSDKIKSVSGKGYMTGYGMQKYVEKGLYRFMSRLGDNMMKMRIAKVEF